MAPTLFSVWNLRIVVYPKDHKSPHVHIVGPEVEAKFNIVTLECVESYGFTEASLKKIREYLIRRQITLMEVWNENQE